ncbi:MAG: type II secretion system protein E [Acidobacteria bacterium]|nr:MAG: type II secretion system protein E [Acidobacteriota bacterium]
MIAISEFGDLRPAIRRSVQESIAARCSAGYSPGTLEVRGLVSQTIVREHPHLSEGEAAALAVELADELSGLGPLQRFLEDRSVTEVMVNGPDEIWIESGGSIQRTTASFEDSQSLRHLIERTVGPLGLRVDDSYPIADARLPDGSRFHAVLPPVARNGPIVTIRKFSERAFSLSDLVSGGALSGEAADFLSAAVRARANMVISGGTSSGKTSLLNALSAEIPAGERLITVEDAAELQLCQPHVVTLEARPPNVDGSGSIGIRDLVRAALRMRPDRIIVGEVRGGEALDMIQAMNTGHEGSLTTVHANSARDLMFRLEAMVLMADLGLAAEVVRHQIAVSIDLVVQLTRFANGERAVWEIAEISDSGDWPPFRSLFEMDGSSSARSLRPVAPALSAPERCRRRGHQWVQ